MHSEGYCTWVCVSVCLCVCLLSHISPMERLFVLKNAVTYSAGNEGQKICGDLPETTAFKSYAAKHEGRSQYANFFRLTLGQLSPPYTQQNTRGYQTIVNNIQPCPKRCLLMPLACVGARTDSTTRLRLRYGAMA